MGEADVLVFEAGFSPIFGHLPVRQAQRQAASLYPALSPHPTAALSVGSLASLFPLPFLKTPATRRLTADECAQFCQVRCFMNWLGFVKLGLV